MRSCWIALIPALERAGNHMLILKGYNPQSISAHSRSGRRYLELEFENEAAAERFYEDAKHVGLSVPDGIDLKMNEDESLGLTTVILYVDAMLKL
jgi:hypothetical protein